MKNPNPFRLHADLLWGEKRSGLTVFVTSVLVEFESYWMRLLD